MTYVTQNTIKGLAFDLVTDYLDSYSGKKHFTLNLSKIKNSPINSLVDSSVEEIMSTTNDFLLNQIPHNKQEFLKEEIYRELINVYQKEKNQPVI